MRYALLPLIGIVLLLGAACSRARPGPAAPPTPWLPISPDARLYSDNAGGVQDTLRAVVRDASALHQIWQQATAGQSSPPPVPSIDFTREMVLVVAAGPMSPEDEIRVDSVRIRRETDASGRTEEVMSVLVRIIEGCGRFTAPAFAIDVVRVRRSEARVSFAERRERAACP